jgi:hypothetical protein
MICAGALLARHPRDAKGRAAQGSSRQAAAAACLAASMPREKTTKARSSERSSPCDRTRDLWGDHRPGGPLDRSAGHWAIFAQA